MLIKIPSENINDHETLHRKSKFNQIGNIDVSNIMFPLIFDVCLTVFFARPEQKGKKKVKLN